MPGFFNDRDASPPTDTEQQRQLLAIATELDTATRRMIILARAAELGEYPAEIEFARAYLECAAQNEAKRLAGGGG